MKHGSVTVEVSYQAGMATANTVNVKQASWLIAMRFRARSSNIATYPRSRRQAAIQTQKPSQEQLSCGTISVSVKLVSHNFKRLIGLTIKDSSTSPMI